MQGDDKKAKTLLSTLSTLSQKQGVQPLQAGYPYKQQGNEPHECIFNLGKGSDQNAEHSV